MKVTRNEAIENLEKAIESYKKLIASNKGTIDQLTRRVQLLRSDNENHGETIQNLSARLKRIKERN